MNVLSGSSGVTRWDGAISPVYYALFTRDKSTCIWYYNYLFRLFPFYRSLIKYGKGILFVESSTGNMNTIRLRISMNDLNNVLIPIPPSDEQKAIVQYLDKQCANIDKITDKLNEEIALFAEYRTRLISDVVTGKLDVRGVAVPEYEVVEDAEDIEEVESEE